MDYKHYIFEGEGYRLKTSKVRFYFLFAFFALIGIICIYLGTTIKTEAAAGCYVMGAVCILLALFILNGRKRKIIIDTNAKTVTVKTAFGKEKQYPFSEFLNFEIIRIRNNGIVTQRSVNIYFNENGKNRAVLLAQVFGKKRGDSLVAETAELLGKNADSDTLTQTQNQYRW